MDPFGAHSTVSAGEKEFLSSFEYWKHWQVGIFLWIALGREPVRKDFYFLDFSSAGWYVIIVENFEGKGCCFFTEAKFSALSEEKKLVTWMRNLFLSCTVSKTKVKHSLKRKKKLWASNEGMGYAEYISICHNFVKEKVDDGVINILYFLLYYAYSSSFVT